MERNFSGWRKSEVNLREGRGKGDKPEGWETRERNEGRKKKYKEREKYVRGRGKREDT